MAPEVLNLPPDELQEWLDALQNIQDLYGPAQTRSLLRSLVFKTHFSGFGSPSPFCNNFPLSHPYPGNKDFEEEIERYIRWNALAMVHKASQYELGGHISTYASIATLYEVGFQHFWVGGEKPDFLFFQGHSSPGIYARSFLEGRFDEESLTFFRREACNPKGLSSYPHPWLMPTYWSFPTVSMGLGPLQAIALARLQVHLQKRGLLEGSPRSIWCFCGDGEMDEPESTSSLGLAGREATPNLIFIVNCNLQRLDGPVRGHGKILQELDNHFSSQGWSVVKLVWSQAWEAVFKCDPQGKILAKLSSLPDLAFQSFSRYGVEYFISEFFSKDPQLAPLLALIPPSVLKDLKPGAHDRTCVFNAYAHAKSLSSSGPVVILAHSIKGYGLESFAQGFNTAHNAKHLSDMALLSTAQALQIPLTEEKILVADFYQPPQECPALQYTLAQRKSLQGFLPHRTPARSDLYPHPPQSLLTLFQSAHQAAPISSTMALVRVMGSLLRTPEFKSLITPVVADEARTFGMEGLIKQLKIYQPCLSEFQPVDKDDPLPYLESLTGQFFQEGIDEAGAAACWLSLATAYTHFSLPLIPFYTYYSMFGFQRVGDLFWAAGDSRARGFLIGATFGRTALSGEGLQHQDGHSLLCMSAIPTMRCYEPCFAFEMAYIIHYGLRCFAQNQDLIFYITATNEKHEQWEVPTDNPHLYDHVIQGMYSLHSSPLSHCHLLASGPLVLEAQKAQEFLEQRYGVLVNLWGVTSFTELRRNALHIDRWNLHNPNSPKDNFIAQQLGSILPTFAVSDSWAIHADQIRPWLPQPYRVLGTDGFGRSDTRENLREHFEISWKYTVLEVISHLESLSNLATKLPSRDALLLDLSLTLSSSTPLSS